MITNRKVPKKKSLTAAAAILLASVMTILSVPSAADASDTSDPSKQAEVLESVSVSADSPTPAAGSTSGKDKTAAASDTAAAEPASKEAGTAETSGTSEKTDTSETESTSKTAQPAAKSSSSDRIKGIVAIDPGHQGPSVDMSALEPDGPGSSNMKAKATSGTTGVFTGIGEYELNMDIALLLREELEKRGYEVVLTREDNETAISNSERAVLANESGADIYLRIHANGVDDSSVSGALAMSAGYDNPWVADLAAKSEELAYDILNCYCSETGMNNQGLTYTNTMTGLNWSEIPAMILEMGYMTNESDDTKMANAEFRSQMVTGIANGVDLWYAVNPSPSAGQPRKMRGGKPAGESTGTSGTDEFPATDEMQKLTDKISTEYVLANEAAGETWGVSVIDLTDRQMSSLNGAKPIKSASVLKLFIMAANYSQLYEGQDSVTEDPDLSAMFEAMITVSDNTAANNLVERLGGGDFETGRARLNDWCKANGYTGTTMGRRFLASEFTEDNYTTADDCAKLLASIYDRKCVNAEASEKMIGLLERQTRLGKIPAGLEGYDVTTGNKTGELADQHLGFTENDAAIVWTEKKDYVLVVLNENLRSNQQAITQINDISKTVYKWLVLGTKE